jgi:hypothetical protein
MIAAHDPISNSFNDSIGYFHSPCSRVLGCFLIVLFNESKYLSYLNLVRMSFENVSKNY